MPCMRIRAYYFVEVYGLTALIIPFGDWKGEETQSVENRRQRGGFI